MVAWVGDVGLRRELVLGPFGSGSSRAVYEMFV